MGEDILIVISGEPPHSPQKHQHHVLLPSSCTGEGWVLLFPRDGGPFVDLKQMLPHPHRELRGADGFVM